MPNTATKIEDMFEKIRRERRVVVQATDIRLKYEQFTEMDLLQLIAWMQLQVEMLTQADACPSTTYHLVFDMPWSNADHNGVLVLRKRLETDDEYNTRLANEDKQTAALREKNEARERAKLAELKAKYE